MFAIKQKQAFINNCWVDITLNDTLELSDYRIRIAEPVRPNMPRALGNFADHSSPLYTKQQMLKAMEDAGKLAVEEYIKSMQERPSK